MDSQYLISLDGGVSHKGPFDLDQIRRMYLEHRLPEEFLIRGSSELTFTAFSAFSPELFHERSQTAFEANERIDRSEREAIAEERKGILTGLGWLLSGTGTAGLLLWRSAGALSAWRIAWSILLAGSGLVQFLACLKSTLERRRGSREAGSTRA